VQTNGEALPRIPHCCCRTAPRPPLARPPLARPVARRTHAVATHAAATHVAATHAAATHAAATHAAPTTHAAPAPRTMRRCRASHTAATALPHTFPRPVARGDARRAGHARTPRTPRSPRPHTLLVLPCSSAAVRHHQSRMVQYDAIARRVRCVVISFCVPCDLVGSQYISSDSVDRTVLSARNRAVSCV
jgi:hypothetical protein